MSRKPPHARIAITLPPETLRQADALAARLDRSRSWVVAEAIRRFAGAQHDAVASRDASQGESRHGQLRRDAALTAGARVLLGEEVMLAGASLGDASAFSRSTRLPPSQRRGRTLARRRRHGHVAPGDHARNP